MIIFLTWIPNEKIILKIETILNRHMVKGKVSYGCTWIILHKLQLIFLYDTTHLKKAILLLYRKFQKMCLKRLRREKSKHFDQSFLMVSDQKIYLT